MNYQHLKYFQILARVENFKKASDILYVTQPALSRAISNLESELGVKLFKTSKTGTKITPYGTEFLKYVDQGLESIERGVISLQQMAKRHEGTVHIGCVYGYVYNYIPEILNSFTKMYPNISMKFTMGTTHDIAEDVSLGTVDIGFYLVSPHDELFTNVDSTIISREEIVLVVPSSWSAYGDRTSCSIVELKDRNFISFNPHSGMLYRTEYMFAQLGLQYEPYITVSNDETILNLVRSGLGAACVLKNILAADDPDIHMMSISDDVDNYAEIRMGVLKNRNYSIALDSFVTYVKEFFNIMPDPDDDE